MLNLPNGTSVREEGRRWQEGKEGAILGLLNQVCDISWVKHVVICYQRQRGGKEMGEEGLIFSGI